MKCVKCGLAPATSYDSQCDNCAGWTREPLPWPESSPAQYSGYATYKDPGGLAMAVIVLLACGIAVDLLALLASANQVSVANALLSNPFGVSVARRDASDGLNAIAALLQIIALAATAVLFVIWFYRVRVNAEYFGPNSQRKGRGWAIGAWFVPVASLWFPKQMADDMWDASTPALPDGGRPRVSHGLLNGWWALWISSLIIGRFVDRIFTDTETAEGIHDAGVASMISDVVSIAAALLAILVVRKLSDRQRAKMHHGQTALYAPAGDPL